jgi:Xaa-Pro aminopeptidase
MYSSFKDHEPHKEEQLIEKMKAVKNEVQQEGMRQSHTRDCASLFKYFSWLNQELIAGKKVTECEGSDKLREFRA